MKKTTLWVLMAVTLVTITLAGCSSSQTPSDQTPTPDQTPVVTPAPVTEQIPTTTAPVKEFAMESFTKVLSGQYMPQYSLKNITVKKGDTVKITITVTSGKHDFNIDEFNVHAMTPSNQPTLVEFTADKTGTFIYYCSMPGHRALGHWGKLTVTE